MILQYPSHDLHYKLRLNWTAPGLIEILLWYSRSECLKFLTLRLLPIYNLQFKNLSGIIGFKWLFLKKLRKNYLCFLIRQEDMLEHELKNSEGIHIHNVLRSPEIENLIPKVYLDTTSIYKYAWWDHSIPKLLERIHGKSQSEKVYSQYRDELGVWKLVRRRCQKCNKDIWNGNVCKRLLKFIGST